MELRGFTLAEQVDLEPWYRWEGWDLDLAVSPATPGTPPDTGGNKSPSCPGDRLGTGSPGVRALLVSSGTQEDVTVVGKGAKPPGLAMGNRSTCPIDTGAAGRA